MARNSSRCPRGKRKVQWQRAHGIARQLRQGGATAVVILGDANSAGYLSDDNGERAFVDAAARGAGMSVVTGELGCSESSPTVPAHVSR